MKVFISWSGPLSREIAIALRDWLRNAVQSLDPYMSDEDIPAGARWLADLSSELANTAFGILCVTRENVATPWLNYEAGALSKTVEDTACVVPLLIDFDSPLPQGPLAQFQSVTIERAGMFKLLQSLNLVSPATTRLDEVRLRRQFDRCWEEFRVAVADALARHSASTEPTPDVDPTQALLQELLDLVREQTRILIAKPGRQQDPPSPEGAKPAASPSLLPPRPMQSLWVSLKDDGEPEPGGRLYDRLFADLEHCGIDGAELGPDQQGWVAVTWSTNDLDRSAAVVAGYLITQGYTVTAANS